MLAIYIMIVPTDGFSIAIVMYGFGLIVVSFLLRKKEYANEIILSRKTN